MILAGELTIAVGHDTGHGFSRTWARLVRKKGGNETLGDIV